MPPLSVLIAGIPDRDDLIAELWCGDLLWAELSREHDAFVLTVYPRPDHTPWLLPFDDVRAVLVQAQRALVGDS